MNKIAGPKHICKMQRTGRWQIVAGIRMLQLGVFTGAESYFFPGMFRYDAAKCKVAEDIQVPPNL